MPALQPAVVSSAVTFQTGPGPQMEMLPKTGRLRKVKKQVNAS